MLPSEPSPWLADACFIDQSPANVRITGDDPILKIKLVLSDPRP